MRAIGPVAIAWACIFWPSLCFDDCKDTRIVCGRCQGTKNVVSA